MIHAIKSMSAIRKIFSTPSSNVLSKNPILNKTSLHLHYINCNILVHPNSRQNKIAMSATQPAFAQSGLSEAVMRDVG